MPKPPITARICVVEAVMTTLTEAALDSVVVETERSSTAREWKALSAFSHSRFTLETNIFIASCLRCLRLDVAVSGFVSIEIRRRNQYFYRFMFRPKKIIISFFWSSYTSFWTFCIVLFCLGNVSIQPSQLHAIAK